MKKLKRSLVIFDNQANPTKEYELPKFVDESLVNKWATRLFKNLREKAVDKSKIDHWDIREEDLAG